MPRQKPTTETKETKKEKKEFTYQIIKEIDTLSEPNEENEKAYDKVVSIVKWGTGEPKLDIRSWSKDRTKMGKGITLTSDEVSALYNILNDTVVLEGIYKILDKNK